MKKLFYILLFWFPVLLNAQQSCYKSSPSENMWTNVGDEGFSIDTAWWTNLVFSPSDEPYVAYSDGGNSDKATVMKFNGTNWGNVGNAGFSAGEADFTSLAFNPSGEPYVAYMDYGNSTKATVMKFDGANWVNVGTAGFSSGSVQWTSLAFSPSDQPYVAYEDWANSAKATVMKFDGTNWLNVGTVGFSEGHGSGTRLTFSLSGQPHVAYEDWANSHKVTVMKYDSVFVGINEPHESKLSLFPNPVTIDLTVNFKNIDGKNKFVEVYDIQGKLMIALQTSKDKIILSTEEYRVGFYILKVKTENSNYIAKFWKN